MFGRYARFFLIPLLKIALACAGVGFMLGGWFRSSSVPLLFLWVLISLCLLFGVVYIGAYRLGKALEGEVGVLRQRVQQLLKADRGSYGKRDSLWLTSSFFSELIPDLETLGRSYQEKHQQAFYFQNLWQTLIDSLKDGILIVDQELCLKQANTSAQFLFALPLPEAIGLPLKETVLFSDLEVLASQVLRRRQPLRQEWACSHSEPRLFDLHLLPIWSLQGGVGGVLLLLKDITQEHRLIAMRQDFVANASHELRTPATSIQVMVESLLNGGLEDKELASQFLTAIARSSKRLVCLVEDLLTLAEAEGRKRPLDPKVIPVRGLFEQVVEDLSGNAQIRRITIGIREISPHLTVCADQEALLVILRNLLDNAIKYTPEGGRVFLEAKEEGDFVHLMVWDTGIGISSEHLPRIWERFYRVDRSRSRELGGTGLGLSIVKHLVEQQQGYVWVKSKPGEGSCFGVAFPKER